MRKKEYSTLIILVLFSVFLTLYNALPNIIYTGFRVFDNPIYLPVNMLVAPFSAIFINITAENWGKWSVRLGFQLGVFIQSVTGFIIVLMQTLTPIKINDEHFLYTNVGLLSFIVSQAVNVYLFYKLRDFLMKKDGITKHRYLWGVLPAVITQFIDSFIMVYVAWGLSLKWIIKPDLFPYLLFMAVGYSLIRVIIVIGFTPVFMRLTSYKPAGGDNAKTLYNWQNKPVDFSNMKERKQ